MKDFNNYGFSNQTLKVLDILKFKTPTKIQTKVIPELLNNKNVVGVSQTGSGKTHAFLLPIIEKITFNRSVQAIIIVPTRELAMQLDNNLKEFKKVYSDLTTTLLIGGKEKKKNITSQIVIGTPGSLFDAINKQNLIKFDQLKYIVLDEADMLFDNNFIEEVDLVLSNVKDNVVFAVFSATISQNMHPFFKKYFKNINVISIEDTIENISHVLVDNKNKNRYDTLLNLTKILNPYLCLIFASKKSEVDEISKKLNEDGIKTIALHGGLNLRDRAKTIKRINALEFKFVVVSDIAARGIDIEGVSHIISYSLPYELDYYIHRAGRTGRYQYSGISYTIFDKEDIKKVEKLQAKGIEFKFAKIVNDSLEYDDVFLRKQRTYDASSDEKLLNKVNKDKKKVKPGYKKKRKEELNKLHKKAKQQEIKDRIRKQRRIRKQENEDITD